MFMKISKEYFKEFKLYKNKNELFFGAVFFLIFFSFLWIFLTTLPINNSLPKTLKIEEGSSLRQISQDLKEAGFIRSKTIFSSFVILKAGEDKIISGEYLFSEKTTFFELIDRLIRGDYGIELRQVRIPEGSTIIEMANLLESIFPDFKKEAFLQLTINKEGYLFPDTYFFPANVKAHEVVEVLEDTFNEKIKDVVMAEGRTLEEVMIMASIVEREADIDSKQEVSNILWKRIDEGMLLQVDAPFVYSIGRGTFDLHKSDLENEDNPYNTYVNKGLPPTPISNPSLESIKSAANPQPTNYLYFLTGQDGKMYYAETFEEHKRNRVNYL